MVIARVGSSAQSVSGTVRFAGGEILPICCCQTAVDDNQMASDRTLSPLSSPAVLPLYFFYIIIIITVTGKSHFLSFFIFILISVLYQMVSFSLSLAFFFYRSPVSVFLLPVCALPSEGGKKKMWRCVDDADVW